MSNQFGQTFTYGRDFELNLTAPKTRPIGDDESSNRVAGKYDQPDLSDPAAKAAAKKQLRSIKSVHADHNIETDVDYPALAEVQAVMAKPDWLPGFKMNYAINGEGMTEEAILPRGAPNGTMTRGFVKKSAARDVPFEVTLWRGMSKADLDGYGGRLRELNTFIAKQSRRTQTEGVTKARPGYLDFLRHVTRESMPADFLILSGTIDEGCAEGAALCCWKSINVPSPSRCRLSATSPARR